MPAATGTSAFARAALVVGLAGLGVWVLHPYLPALAWAVILSIALWPLRERLVRIAPPGRHNVLWPALLTLVVALVILVPLVVAAVQAAREAHDAIGFWRRIEEQGWPVPDFVARLPFGAAQVSAWWQENLSHPQGSSEVLHRLDQSLNHSSVVGFGRTFGSQIVHRAVLFGFTLLTLFFLFRDGSAVAAQALSAARRLFGPRGERVARQMVASVHGTVDGLVLVGLGEGFLLGVVYAFAGVPHPVLLGAATALAAMIPFAAPVAFGLAALLAGAQGSVTAAVVVVVAGLVVTFVADHFVRPALIGGATRLPFLWVLLGILGGVESFGLLGLFLGPAVMAALVLLWREYTAGDDRPVS
ncbi:transporter [Methylobacterium variabile]|uniref:Transporter n=1 Tax=Methylobacterium variabile TaxID=298794 RepID=A0A0J6SXU2_9HYPH|nr:transporter [Methylobacterium variabile]